MVRGSNRGKDIVRTVVNNGPNLDSHCLFQDGEGSEHHQDPPYEEDKETDNMVTEEDFWKDGGAYGVCQLYIVDHC